MKTLSADKLNVVRRVVLEIHRRPTKPNKCSLPIKLGSATKVLINPSVKDTENPGLMDQTPTAAETLRNKSVREAYRIYNRMVIANDEEVKRRQ